MATASTETFCNYCGTPSQGQSYCCSACEVLDLRVGPLPLLKENLNPYSYLDKAEFRDLYRQRDSEFDYVFFAEGLHCSSCVHLLEKLPQFYSEIVAARVNFAQSTVAVKLTEAASLAQVAHAINELGYQPSLLSAKDNLSHRFTEENRAFLKRIAVAGFSAGNTMLFVIPVYAGLAGSLGTLFNWLSFVLFLPILFYSAVPFYRGALSSLKYKVVNVDLPIAIAMLSGFLLSTYNLIRGNGAIYFDSTASFIFFILSARYLLKRVQQNYLSTSNIKSFFQNENYLLITNSSQEEPIHWSNAKIGDVLRIKRGQSLPSDCELVSNQATMDMSLFNGESLPKVFTKGMLMFAGTKALDEDILVRVQFTFSDSKLGRLLYQLDQGALLKSRFVALTDRLAQKLIITVFAIAILFFALYMNIDFEQAFNRSLALIVLACPCALAFGSPLTFGLALKKATQNGLLLKDATSLERMLNIKNVFFDKTGTLTEGALSLSHSEPALVSPTLQKVILSLEAPSYHPIAFALRKAWSVQELFPVEEAQEILGKGVRGKINGDVYEIRHLAESTHESEIAIEVFKNNESVSRLYFSDALREDALSSVKELQKQGLQCFILSGDKKVRVMQAANRCGIGKENVYGELFPEDKKEILAKYKNTCMIGDGANDSLSLQAADVGIAVKGSVDLSLHSADVYFTRGGLKPLFDLIKLAKNTHRVLIRNLTLSLIYNTVGGSLALLGYINPMMAAILMPISSIIIILSSLWGFR